jgi:hypothetical protein
MIPSYSLTTIKLNVVTKAFDSNQWPLDWFITHVITTKFKQLMTAFAMAQT